MQLRDSSSPSAPARLYVAGPDGAFRLLAGDIGEEPVDPLWPPLVRHRGRRVHAGGRAATARAGGTRRRWSCRPRAPPASSRPPASVGVASTEGALIVFDLRSGPSCTRSRSRTTTRRSRASPSRRTATSPRPWPSGDGSESCCGRPQGLPACARSRARCGWSRSRPRAGGWLRGLNRLDAGVRVTILDGATGRARVPRPGDGDGGAPVLRRHPPRVRDRRLHAAGDGGHRRRHPARSLRAHRDDGHAPRGRAGRGHVPERAVESCRVRAAGRTTTVPRGRTRAIRLPRGATVRVIDPAAARAPARARGCRRRPV